MNSYLNLFLWDNVFEYQLEKKCGARTLLQTRQAIFTFSELYIMIHIHENKQDAHFFSLTCRGCFTWNLMRKSVPLVGYFHV
jgi:hypothetical protein